MNGSSQIEWTDENRQIERRDDGRRTIVPVVESETKWTDPLRYLEAFMSLVNVACGPRWREKENDWTALDVQRVLLEHRDIRFGSGGEPYHRPQVPCFRY
jgi:hypothetical protein